MSNKNPINYFKGVGREAKRVRWPKKDQLLPSIAVVLCIVIFAALFLSLEDLAANTIIEQIKEAFKNLQEGKSMEEKLPEEQWYIVTTYSGNENKAKENIERRIVSYNLED